MSKKKGRKNRRDVRRAYSLEEVKAMQARFKREVIDKIDNPVEAKKLLAELRAMPKMLGGSKWFRGRRGRLSRGQIQNAELAKVVEAALAAGDPLDRPICTKAVVNVVERDPLERNATGWDEWDRIDEALEVVQQVGRGRTFVADSTGRVTEFPVIAVTAAVGSWLVEKGRLPRELLPRITKVRLVKKKPPKPEPQTKELPKKAPRPAPGPGEVMDPYEELLGPD